MKRPKAHWFVRRAKLNGVCLLCKQQTLVGDSIVRWGGRWAHFECAKVRDAQLCADS